MCLRSVECVRSRCKDEAPEESGDEGSGGDYDEGRMRWWCDELTGAAAKTGRTSKSVANSEI